MPGGCWCCIIALLVATNPASGTEECSHYTDCYGHLFRECCPLTRECCTSEEYGEQLEISEAPEEDGGGEENGPETSTYILIGVVVYFVLGCLCCGVRYFLIRHSSTLDNPGVVLGTPADGPGQRLSADENMPSLPEYPVSDASCIPLIGGASDAPPPAYSEALYYPAYDKGKTEALSS